MQVRGTDLDNNQLLCRSKHRQQEYPITLKDYLCSHKIPWSGQCAEHQGLSCSYASKNKTTGYWQVIGTEQSTIPIWCNVSFQSMICLSNTRFMELSTSIPLLPVAVMEVPCVSEVASSNTNGSLIGNPSSVIIGAVIILQLPTWESISLHSSFHLKYCILWSLFKEKHAAWFIFSPWVEKGFTSSKREGTVVANGNYGNYGEKGWVYLLLSLIWSRSSKVLPGSKQPSKNSQTSPLIAGCTPWHTYREVERDYNCFQFSEMGCECEQGWIPMHSTVPLSVCGLE